MQRQKTGILVANIGSPLSPRVREVRSYLHRFLMDKKILPLPWFFRFLLVYGYIVPLRVREAAKRYKEIWTPQGAPLVAKTQEFVQDLQEELGDSYLVRAGMVLGSPSIDSGMEALWGQCDQILFLPMFPQYADSSTGAVLFQLFRYLSRKKTTFCPEIRTLPAFYMQPMYIDSMVDLVRAFYRSCDHDHLLFSYHGLPDKAIQKSLAENGPCYRSQCLAITASVAAKMELSSETYSTCFQSRLGRQPWTRPYAEEALLALYDRGIRRVAMVCPGFAVDCLETQMEIGIELQEWWVKQGGVSIDLFPCLNNRSFWVHQMAQWIASLR
jgi:ferrochelatase